MNHPRTGFFVLLLTLLSAMGCTLDTSGLPNKGGAQDTTQPTVSSTEPKNAATDVVIGTMVNAVFSEAMAPSTLTGATFTLAHAGESAAGAVTYAEGTATFTPMIALALGTLYTATITTGANDLAHNAVAANYTWSFTTRTVANTTPPTVTSTIPTNGALNVAANAELSATFSEALDPLTVTDSTFSVTKGGTPIAGTVTYAGMTATFAPASPLDLDGVFLATVTTGVTDLLGNALADKFTWTFTTTTRPTVIAESPVAGAQGAAINTHIEATFSVAMDPATITTETFLVKQGATPVSGTVTYLDTTATFTPTNNYLPNATLTVVITTGAKDLSGSALDQDHVWSFQTGTKANQAPVALGVAFPFAVLASDTIANTASVGTIVTGDLGISPGASLMGFPPGVIVGQTFLGAGAAAAKFDFLKAYNDAAGRPDAAALPADIAAHTFTPGLYGQVSAVALSAGSCTLDAEGDPNAVFIFQIGTAFGLAASTEIILIGDAKATNIYWVVGASVTLGATSKLKGTILAVMDITLGAGATVEGRLLAGGATVTLDTNVITVPAL